MKTAKLAALLLLIPLAGHADATSMCLQIAGTTESQCDCASEALDAEIGDGEAALYDATGTRYLANRAAGQGMGDAWDAAIAETAAENGMGATELLSRMNDVGKAHRAAIGSCG